jgi:hypothetical protein
MKEYIVYLKHGDFEEGITINALNKISAKKAYLGAYNGEISTRDVIAVEVVYT